MTLVQAHVAARVRQCRTDLRWSQVRLAREVRRYGLAWTPAVIAQVEKGTMRADRLVELYALCSAFRLSLSQFLGERAPVALPDGTVGDVGDITAALGGVFPAEPPPEVDDVWEVQRVARRVGLTPVQFMDCIGYLFHRNSWSWLRDELMVWNDVTNDYDEAIRRMGRYPDADRRWTVIPEGDKKVTAQRGHATRYLLDQVRKLAGEPVTAQQPPAGGRGAV